MYLSSKYEVIYDALSNTLKLKDRNQNKLLPHIFNSIDMRSCERTGATVIKVTIRNNNKLFNLETGEPLKYEIEKWGNDCTYRYITMKLRDGHCAIYDTVSNKINILPSVITETYVDYFYKDGYCLVKLFGGMYSYFHMKKKFILDAHFNIEDLKENKYQMNWKEIVVNSPEDFIHLPKKYFEDKKLIKQLLKRMVEKVKEKKHTMPKDEYTLYFAKIKDICQKRLASEYPNSKISES